MIFILTGCLKKIFFLPLAIVLWGGSFAFSQNISYEKRDYEVSKHVCAEGICGTVLPVGWYDVVYEDTNTLIPKLPEPVPLLNSQMAVNYLAQGYDIECPFTVKSGEYCLAVNPTSIYQLHFPQKFPTPLDEYLEYAVPLPQVFRSVDWLDVPISSSVKVRRKMRIEELFVLTKKYEQMKLCKKFNETKFWLERYGVNFVFPRMRSWMIFSRNLLDF